VIYTSATDDSVQQLGTVLVICFVAKILGNPAQNRLADCLFFFIPKVSPQSGVPACDNAIKLFAGLDELSATVEIISRRRISRIHSRFLIAGILTEFVAGGLRHGRTLRGETDVKGRRRLDQKSSPSDL
jgi:hypothetical protein